MVSKVARKTSLRPRAPPPETLGPSPSAVRRSLRSCQEQFLRIFTHLAILSAATKKLDLSHLKPFLSPVQNDRKTIVLDLDETLIHARTYPPPKNYDFIVRPNINGSVIPFYVVKRPGVDKFLKMASQSFEIIIFTAGLREYASLVIDSLDPEGEVISQRFYRDSCEVVEGKFVKDLKILGRGLGEVVIVDDNPSSYSLQPGNAFPVKAFVNDMKDEELERVLQFLEIAREFDDMRDAIKFILPKEPKSSWMCLWD